MNGERAAVEAYCASVQSAETAAYAALAQIAFNSDPSSEIVSYLLSMAQSEFDAEVARMEALGTYQIAVKMEYLAQLSPTDPRYEAALADLAWTQSVVEVRNGCFPQLGLPTMQYSASVYSAQLAYGNASKQLQYSLQTAQRQKANDYATEQRQLAWDLAARNLQRERTLELSLLDAAFTKWENETNFEAQQAGTLLANYQAGLDAIDDVDDVAATIGMYDNLNSSLSGWQSAATAESSVFRTGLETVYNEAVSAARSTASAQNAADDAWYTTVSGGAIAAYEAGYYSDLAEYVAADGATYENYVSAVETAQREFAEEQCRLLGLLQDSINTGENNVAEETSSLDVQVCFPAGFEVDLADGTAKKIEEFKGGEEVWARPHDNPNGPLQKCKLVRVFKNEPKETIKVLFDNGLEIQATAEHPFFVPEKGWVSCEKLDIGDACVNRGGEFVRVVSKELVTEPVSVYNIEVEGAHTYYVGKDGLSLLVHNDCSTHYYSYDNNCPDCRRNREFQARSRAYNRVPEIKSVNSNIQELFHIPLKDQIKFAEQGLKLTEKEASKYYEFAPPSGGRWGLNQFIIGSTDKFELGVGGSIKIDNLSEQGRFLL